MDIHRPMTRAWASRLSHEEDDTVQTNPRKRVHFDDEDEDDQPYTPRKKIQPLDLGASWIPEFGLNLQDKHDIEKRRPVAFRVAEAAVAILREQFMESSRRPGIRVVEEQISPIYKPTIQLHLDYEEGHAFVTACDGKKVLVADSLPIGDYTPVGFQQINDSYKRLLKDFAANIQILNVQQQTRREQSCVMYSSANMLELLTPGGNPECRYIKEYLRPHFIQCLENKRFTPFPKLPCSSPKKPLFDWQSWTPRIRKLQRTKRRWSRVKK